MLLAAVSCFGTLVKQIAGRLLTNGRFTLSLLPASSLALFESAEPFRRQSLVENAATNELIAPTSAQKKYRIEHQINLSES